MILIRFDWTPGLLTTVIRNYFLLLVNSLIRRTAALWLMTPFSHWISSHRHDTSIWLAISMTLSHSQSQVRVTHLCLYSNCSMINVDTVWRVPWPKGVRIGRLLCFPNLLLYLAPIHADSNLAIRTRRNCTYVWFARHQFDSQNLKLLWPT